MQLWWLTLTNCPYENPYLVGQCGVISVLIGAASEHFFASVTGLILLAMM